MFSSRKIWAFLGMVVVLALIVSACAPAATPTPERIVETVVVPVVETVEVPVVETVEVPVVETVEVPVVETVEVPVEKKLKAAWIYVGPIGDYGWSHAHEQARLIVQEKFPWLEALPPAEAVPEADVDRYIERYIVEEGADVVFTTSFGFMDGTIDVAGKHPDKILFHCSGYERAPNVGTYFAEFHQLYYLNGLMAGALTETGKVGYVAAHPLPEVVRHINAFALGVKEVNPEATVDVRWLFAWYDPAKAREAAESLIAVGADVLAFTEDSPTVIEVGQEYVERGEPVYTFSHYSPMQQFGPDSCVSGQLVHWEILYEDILAKIYAGEYTTDNLENVDYWWMLREGAAELGGEFGVPINPKFEEALQSVKVQDSALGEISVYDLVFARLEQMSEDTVLFDPFTGPIRDQEGNIRIEAGRRGTHDELWLMDWFVENVVAEIPR